jgi:hypothetical protein
MGHRFRQHYTRDEARALLPQIQTWLRQLKQFREKLAECDKRIAQLAKSGQDLGGESVNHFIQHLAGLKTVLHEFQRREIQIKDLDRGLIDFPAIIGGREVFLCWEEDEEDIEYWHDLDTGYAGREPLP